MGTSVSTPNTQDSWGRTSANAKELSRVWFKWIYRRFYCQFRELHFLNLPSQWCLIVTSVSQISGNSNVRSTACLAQPQIKHQRSAVLSLFVMYLPVDSGFAAKSATWSTLSYYQNQYWFNFNWTPINQLGIISIKTIHLQFSPSNMAAILS